MIGLKMLEEEMLKMDRVLFAQLVHLTVFNKDNGWILGSRMLTMLAFTWVNSRVKTGTWSGEFKASNSPKYASINIAINIKSK